MGYYDLDKKKIPGTNEYPWNNGFDRPPMRERYCDKCHEQVVIDGTMNSSQTTTCPNCLAKQQESNSK